MTDGPLDRRGVLRGLGVAAVLGTAGCNGLSLRREDDTRFAADALRTVTDDPAPTIPETLPVAIEPTYLEGLAADVRETVAPVPAPLTAEDVPNGVIREDLAHLRDHVQSYLQEAHRAPSPYEAMETYRRAASTATELATAWAAIDDGVTRDDVAGRRETIRQTRTRFVRQWSHRGDDPCDAVVLHATLERRVHSAKRILADDGSDRPDDLETALTIGELAGDLEQARTAIAAADYLYGRHTDAMGTEGTDLRGTFEAAARTLGTTLDERAGELPDGHPNTPSAFVDRDISGTLAAEVLESLYRMIEPARVPDEELAGGRPANAVLGAGWVLARIRAFESVRERVANGASYSIETVDDIRAIRTDAVDALTAASERVDAPVLANEPLARLADDLRQTDRRLTRRDRIVDASVIDWEVSQYVETAAMARAVPPTVEQIARALRSAT